MAYYEKAFYVTATQWGSLEVPVSYYRQSSSIDYPHSAAFGLKNACFFKFTSMKRSVLKHLQYCSPTMIRWYIFAQNNT